MGLAPSLISLNFEADLDHCLDTKKERSRFSYLPTMTCLGGVIPSLSTLDRNLSIETNVKLKFRAAVLLLMPKSDTIANIATGYVLLSFIVTLYNNQPLRSMVQTQDSMWESS